MKARRFEEVLEECLAAQLEGRRTVEESLSLYPSLACELEPLLRAAASLSDVYQRASPPPYIVELGRERFLAAAAARARARAGVGRARHQSGPWGLRLWGAVGAAAAAALAAAAVGIAALIGSGGGGEEMAGSGPPDTGPAPAVLNLNDWQQAHEHLKDAAQRGAPIPQADLETIKAFTEKWKGVDPTTLRDEERLELEQAVRQQYETLAGLTAGQPGPVPPDEIFSVLGSTKELADKLGLQLPGFSPAPASPGGTATPEPQPSPSPPPEATPGPAPTPAPSPEGESVPTDPIFQPS